MPQTHLLFLWTPCIVFKELRATFSFGCAFTLFLFFSLFFFLILSAGERGLFPFHLGMNSVSRRAWFTEPTRENKDVLIRNIRGERAVAFVNEPGWGWAAAVIKLKKKKKSTYGDDCSEKNSWIFQVPWWYSHQYLNKIDFGIHKWYFWWAVGFWFFLIMTHQRSRVWFQIKALSLSHSFSESQSATLRCRFRTLL